MALQIASEFAGIELPTAYCRVKNTQISTPADRPYSITINVDVFASAAAKAAGAPPIRGMDFTFTDIPEKIEKVPVMENGVQIKDADGQPITEDVVIPAHLHFTELYEVLSAGGDPRAMVYEALKSRRHEFDGSLDV